MALKVTFFEIQLITLASDVLQFTLNARAVRPGLIVKLAHSDTFWTLDFVLVSLLSQQTLLSVQHDSWMSDMCGWSCLFSLQFWVRQGLVFQYFLHNFSIVHDSVLSVQFNNKLSDLRGWSCLFSLQFWVRQGLVFQYFLHNFSIVHDSVLSVQFNNKLSDLCEWPCLFSMQFWVWCRSFRSMHCVFFIIKLCSLHIVQYRLFKMYRSHQYLRDK
jgi:hypothetical protein